MSTKIKATEFVSNAKKYLGSCYAYGYKGEIATESKIKSLAKQYPSVYTSSYLTRTLKHVGKFCVDCSGLIYLACNKTYCLGSSQLYERAKSKGKIVSVAEAPIGAVLYKKGHVGIKISKTEHIESRGVDYGIVIKNLSTQAWQCALLMDYIDYSDIDESNTFDNVDWVKRVQKILGVTVDGSFGTNTLNSTITISKTTNRKHALVSLLQEKLSYLGYYTDKIDGIAGNNFDAATKKWQSEVLGYKNPDGEFTAKGKSWKEIAKI